MLGVRLIPGSEGCVVPPGTRSLFSYLFAPIAENLRPLYWYADRYDSSPFNDIVTVEGREEWYEQAVVKLPSPRRGLNGSGLLFRPGTLPDAAAYLHDDWVDLIGIDAAKHDPVEIAQRFRGQRGDPDARLMYLDEIARVAEFYFHCMDGWWWEVYCARDDLLRRVIEHGTGDDSLTVVRTTLGEKTGRG